MEFKLDLPLLAGSRLVCFPLPGVLSHFSVSKSLTSIHGFLQLEINNHLNNRSSREVHRYDSQALVRGRLGLQVVVQLLVDYLGDGSGGRKDTSSTAVGEKDLAQVSSRCSLQVIVDTPPFLKHI